MPNCRDFKRLKAITRRARGSNDLPLKTRPAGADDSSDTRSAKRVHPPRRSGGVSPVFNRGWFAILMFGLILSCGIAHAQTLNARRLGMGGVVTSDNGDPSGSNIAFRAVPKAAIGGTGSIPLPLGLIQYLADHPTFDSKDSTFNIYEVANVILNP